LVPLAEQTNAPALDMSGDAFATAMLSDSQAITHQVVHRLRRIQSMAPLSRALKGV
jgi:hypothetical protein